MNEKFFLPQGDVEDLYEKKEKLSFEEWTQQLDSAKDFYEYTLCLKKMFDISSFEEVENFVFKQLEKLDRGELISPDPKAMELSNWTDRLATLIDEEGYEQTIYTEITYNILNNSEVAGTEEKRKFVVRFLEKLIQWTAHWMAEENEYQQSLNRTTDMVWGMSDLNEDIASQSDEEWGFAEIEGEGLLYDEVINTKNIERLIRFCGRTGIQEALPTIIQALEELPVAYFNKTIAEALSSLGPQEAAPLLLKKIRSDETSREHKAIYGRILYLLEMGQIEVSQGIVEYLSKKYNLQGVERDRVASAIRITGDGKLGLFDKENTLLSYIELGNFEEREESESQMMEITAELLLQKKIHDEEREEFEKEKQAFLQDYHKVFFENFIAKKTGARVNNLSLREQFWFYQYLKEASDEREKVVANVKKFGEDFLRVFLSIQTDKKIVEKVLHVIEKTDENITREILKKYSQLVFVSDSVNDHLEKLLDERTKKKETEFTATSELMKRATHILQDWSGTHTSNQKTEQALQYVETGVMTFAALAKALKKENPQLELTELRGVDIEIVDAENLTDDDKKAMIVISEENNMENGDIRPFGEKVVLPSLKKSFEKKGNKFFILKKDQKVISFLRLEKEREKESVYFGSFNVNKNAQSAGMGETMMRKIIDREASHSTIEANVELNNPIAEKYINDYGFVITGILKDVAGTGVTGFDIVRDDRVSYERKINNGNFVLEFSSEQEGEFIAHAKEYVNSGKYVISSFRFNKKRNVYECLFEERHSAQEFELEAA